MTTNHERIPRCMEHFLPVRVLNGFRILHCIALHRHRHCHCHSHSPEFNNHIKSERIKFVTLDPSLTYF